MSEFRRGDIVISENRAYKVCGFTKDRLLIPDGWPVTEAGTAINPKFCELYSGAKSVLRLNLDD